MISTISFALEPVSGLASVVDWLIGITSSIAVGVILFTLILKLITFPFDLYSKISMRKNSLKMEEMRPELEKLQAQYANDKARYNQKMLALYKQNGYSMWGACLPTIITLVIFIVAISAFTSYSNFQNRKYFYNMSVAYNQVIYGGLDDGATEGEANVIYLDENGKLVVENDKLFIEVKDGGSASYSKNPNVKMEYVSGSNNYTVYTVGGYTKYIVDVTKTGESYSFATERFSVDNETLKTSTVYGTEFNTALTQNAELTAVDFIKDKCRQASADKYNEEKAEFLWIKNIFVPDSMFESPIYAEWDDFKGAYGYEEIDEDTGALLGNMSAENYNELTYKLSVEKEEYNGYFILVVLTAGSSLLLQLITMKSQKAQNELQTVDGQGAVTQKVMMWIMPIMMAIFAFMYTAAFSIYIVINSTISIATTVITNFALNKKFAKVKAEKESKPIRGRVYVPKEEPKENKKDKKKDKKNQTPDNDFLSGLADKKKNKKKNKDNTGK